MTEYPAKALSRDVTGAIATAFSEGGGPSASRLLSAVALANIDVSGMPDLNKEASVHWAFDNAREEAAYRLMEELLLLVRQEGRFTNRLPSFRQWVDRAQVAFERSGFFLDANGYVDWFPTIAEKSPVKSLQAVVTNQGGSIEVPERPARSDPTGSSFPPIPVDQRTQPPHSGVASALAPAPDSSESKEIFLVHGHDEAARNEVEVFITRTTGITPIVLMLEPSNGLTVIEKFEKHADRSGFAVVLMTDDDSGNAKADAAAGRLNPRPRQNVVFEFGYFVGAIRRAHVAALIGVGVEKPSDVAGLVYIPYGVGTDWRDTLRRELRAAGITVS